MRKHNIDSSTKNIPVPPRKLYLRLLTQKIDLFAKRLRWRTFFYDRYRDNQDFDTKERLGFNAYKFPPPNPMLSPFENDLFPLVKSINKKDYRMLSPRERLSYTRHQLQLLNGIFERVRYPNNIQKQIIATRIGINREQVKVWFQNRRRKEVVGKQKIPTESSVDKNGKESSPFTHGASISYTPFTSFQPKSAEEQLIPTVVLTSIIYELERFNNYNKYGGRKTHANLMRGENNHVIADYNKKPDESETADDSVRTECFEIVDDEKKNKQHVKTKSPKTSLCNPQNKYKNRSLSQQPTKSSKNNIFISAYDIKSPPNQITPTAIFTLKNYGPSNKSNIGTGSWMLHRWENGLAINSIDIHTSQRINSNSYTNVQNFKNYSFTELSPRIHDEKNNLSSFKTPKSTMSSNYTNVVSLSTGDSFDNQLPMFPAAVDSPTFNQSYQDRLVRFHQGNLPEFRNLTTPQQFFTPPQLRHNVDASFPYSNNRDF